MKLIFNLISIRFILQVNLNYFLCIYVLSRAYQLNLVYLLKTILLKDFRNYCDS